MKMPAFLYSFEYPFAAKSPETIITIMLIDLTQHATRCSDSSGQAQEYLIARHAAVETETVLVQICLELGAPSVICSLKECFQITDCLVYPMQIITWTIAGLLAAVASIVFCARIDSITANSSGSYAMNAMAAAIMGGITFAGRTGTISGAFLGCLMLGVINNAMNILKVPSFVQTIVSGAIIVAALIVSNFKAGRKK